MTMKTLQKKREKRKAGRVIRLREKRINGLLWQRHNYLKMLEARAEEAQRQKDEKAELLASAPAKSAQDPNK